jgi:hypothetical protein
LRFLRSTSSSEAALRFPADRFDEEAPGMQEVMDTVEWSDP